MRGRAPHVDVVIGTHNVHRAAELLHAEARRGGPVTEILARPLADDHAAFPPRCRPAGRSPTRAWVTIQIGCDNTCAFCIVPSVRGREISRPSTTSSTRSASWPAAGVTEVTLLGQNVNCYGRDLHAGRPPAAGIDAPAAAVRRPAARRRHR